jgi:hypothetical protein
MAVGKPADGGELNGEVADGCNAFCSCVPVRGDGSPEDRRQEVVINKK